jgi:tRNA threonylcarbamoyladenosine biosynthesis protein TsaE
MKIIAGSEADLHAFAERLCRSANRGCLIYLRGDLGAGKTTLVRGFLRAAGHAGVVKSPTFTLVEEYHVNDRRFFHFDLYRLTDPEELEWMGFRDYLSEGATCFVEWPERGGEWLPRPDIDIQLTLNGSLRLVDVSARSAYGAIVIKALQETVADE